MNFATLALVFLFTIKTEWYYNMGLAMGNNERHFSVAGDSNSDNNYFLKPIPKHYDTDIYPADQFTRHSYSSRVGWSIADLLNPDKSDEDCDLGWSPLECEIRYNNPQLMFIMIGTNDAYQSDMSIVSYKKNLVNVIHLLSYHGVTPILSTLPYMPSRPGNIWAINETIRNTARDFDLPLIDHYADTVNLPNFGLVEDNIHISGLAMDVRNDKTMQVLHDILMYLPAIEVKDYERTR